MSGSTEEVKKHIAVYWKVFGGLMVLTILTVAVSYLSVAVPLAIVISLVYSTSRYELPSKIITRAGRMFLTIMIFMGIVFVVLDTLSFWL